MQMLKEAFTPVFLVRALAGVLVTAGVAWGISFKVADYVAAQHTKGFDSAIAALSQRQNSDQQNQVSVDEGLREELRALVSGLRETNAQLGDLGKTIAGLDGTMRAMDSRLSDSIARQTDFERFVTGVLIQQVSPANFKSAGEVMAEWQIGAEVYDNLAVGASKGDFLNAWVEMGGRP